MSLFDFSLPDARAQTTPTAVALPLVKRFEKVGSDLDRFSPLGRLSALTGTDADSDGKGKKRAEDVQPDIPGAVPYAEVARLLAILGDV